MWFQRRIHSLLDGRLLDGRLLAGRILAGRILAGRILAGRILARIGVHSLLDTPWITIWNTIWNTRLDLLPSSWTRARAAAMSGSIDQRASFGFIRYASVWEDADVLCDALAPAARGGRLLSIASAGDNALALLTLDPAEVVAADLSAPQLACVELRMAAFRRLEYADLLAFLGADESARRGETYRALRGELSEGARSFWDAQPQIVAGGIIHAGRFERYLRTFRTRILPWVHTARRIERLRERRTTAEQSEFYAREWDTWRWRLLFRLFFSRAVMGRMGRDPAFFAQVEGTVGDRILARTRYALTELPVQSNPYLAYIMTGNYPAEALPRYLRPEWFAAIRERIGRVKLVQGPIETAGDGPFDGYNLSDIFEYMPPAEHDRCYTALVDRAAPGARLVYWNLLAPRSRPPALADRVRPLRGEADALHARDLAWFYGKLHVDEVA